MTRILTTPARLAVLALFAILFTVPAAHTQARTIYGDPAGAHAEVRDALARAAREHKRVILDFGGNWCGDCQVLDIYFHREPNAALLAGNFILVDINIGHFDANEDIAQKYDVPLHKGVPALAVLDSHGKLLYSQTNGEFESMRRMDPNSVTDFLQHWKATRN
ncbi:MAG TPA: thioredoxin family protein [Acidobacteriaceae bacterium]|jgi:thiol:disulfide interchange protein|nr:thioredoxin family protein [Acidobacteriaceae bacterium]